MRPFNISLLLTLIWAVYIHAQAPSRSADGTQPETDLREQVAKLAEQQAEMAKIVERLATLLTNPVAVDAACERTFDGLKNQSFKVQAKGCVGFSEYSESLSFTLRLENITQETLFVGARCCNSDWLTVVDDRGRAWFPDPPGKVSQLPMPVDRHFVPIGPGAEILISAVVRTRNLQKPTDAPLSISVTAELLRRTDREEDAASRTRLFTDFPPGRPISVGISRVPVSQSR